MHFIGITGGVGAGKSKILQYLNDRYGAYIIESDKLAKKLMEPGTELYNKVRDAFYQYSVYDENGDLIREKMAEMIFKDPVKMELLNSIVHPAVKREIKDISDKLRTDGKEKLLVVEAALLIEDNYDEICDELWYIYAGCDTRRVRLISTRGYSDDKVSDMMEKQNSDLEFRNKCKRYIDNNGDIETAYSDIDIAVNELEYHDFGGNRRD